MYKKWIKPKNNLAIEIQNLNKTYKSSSKNTIALSDINLNIKCGSFYGLLGPNGAGKTTTFYMLVGLIRCDQGQIYMGDENITNSPMHIRSDLGVSYLPQEASIFRGMNVEDNLLSIIEIQYGTNCSESDILRGSRPKFD